MRVTFQPLGIDQIWNDPNFFLQGKIYSVSLEEANSFGFLSSLHRSRKGPQIRGGRVPVFHTGKDSIGRREAKGPEHPRIFLLATRRECKASLFTWAIPQPRADSKRTCKVVVAARQSMFAYNSP